MTKEVKYGIALGALFGSLYGLCKYLPSAISFRVNKRKFVDRLKKSSIDGGEHVCGAIYQNTITKNFILAFHDGSAIEVDPCTMKFKETNCDVVDNTFGFWVPVDGGSLRAIV